MKAIMVVLFIISYFNVGYSQTKWDKIEYSDALAKAKKENKLVLIKFYTDWCVPCKQVEEVVFQKDKKISSYVNKNYVKLSINAEKEGSEIAKKYKVGAYPTILFLDGDENVLGKVVGTRGNEEYFETIKTAGKSDIEYLEKRKNSKEKNK